MMQVAINKNLNKKTSQNKFKETFQQICKLNTNFPYSARYICYVVIYSDSNIRTKYAVFFELSSCENSQDCIREIGTFENKSIW